MLDWKMPSPIAALFLVLTLSVVGGPFGDRFHFFVFFFPEFGKISWFKDKFLIPEKNRTTEL